MLNVSKCEDESARDPRYKHCFELNTQGRGYLFSADTEEDMTDWIHVFEQLIPQDAAENLVSIHSSHTAIHRHIVMTMNTSVVNRFKVHYMHYHYTFTDILLLRMTVFVVGI